MLGGLLSQLGVIQLGTALAGIELDLPTSTRARGVLIVTSSLIDVQAVVSEASHVKVEP